MDKKFEETFVHYRIHTDDWAETMERYVLHGIPPGGFMESLLTNNLFMTACRSHPNNNWKDITTLVKWVFHCTPNQCHGSPEKVDYWLGLDSDTRRKICEEKGIQMSMMDHLREPPKGVT